MSLLVDKNYINSGVLVGVRVDPNDANAVIRAQLKWLNTLQKLPPGRPILIKAIEGKIPEEADPDLYRWRPYYDIWPKVTDPIYTRGILPNELLIDPDTPEWDVMKGGIEKIIGYCEKNRIPFIKGFSGGKGIHLSIFFGNITIENELSDEIKKIDIDVYKTVRRALITSLAYKAGVNLDEIRLDWGKINFSVEGKGSQVRTFGTTRAPGQYKTLINIIPDHKPEPYELPLVFPEMAQIWEIEGTEYETIAKEALKREVEKAKKLKEYVLTDVDFTGIEIMKFPCVKNLFEAGIENGRYYAGLSVLLMCKKCGVIKEDARRYLIELFNTFPNLTIEEIDLRINNALPLYDSNKSFSCRKLKEHFGENFCKFSECPVREKIKESEELTESDYLMILKNTTILNYNLRLPDAKKFIQTHMMDERKDFVEAFLDNSMKTFFQLTNADIRNIKSFYNSAKKTHDSAKAREKARNDLHIDNKYDDMYTMHLINKADERIRINPHPDKIADLVLEENHILSYKDTLFIYRDGFFRAETETVTDKIIDVLNDICKGDNSDHMDRKVGDILAQIRTKSRVHSYPFNDYKNALPVENGVLVFDFEKGTCELIDHDPTLYKFNYKVPVYYDRNTENTIIYNLLKGYCEKPEILIQIPAQSFMQAMGHGPYKRAYLIYGKKNSGKTTFEELLEYLVGEDGFCDISLDKINQRFQIASLEGKLLNLHDDVGYFTINETGTFKTITGRRNHEIERKGVQPYTATLDAVHVFTTNTPAKFDSRIKADEAYWERWEFITFGKKYSMRGDFKAQTFTQENLTAFLNYIVDEMLKIGKSKKLPSDTDWIETRERWMLAGNPLYCMVNELMTPEIFTVERNKSKGTKGTAIIKEELLKILQMWCLKSDMDRRVIPDSVKDLTSLVDACGWDTDAQRKFIGKSEATRCYVIPYKWKMDEESLKYRTSVTDVVNMQETLY